MLVVGAGCETMRTAGEVDVGITPDAAFSDGPPLEVPQALSKTEATKTSVAALLVLIALLAVIALLPVLLFISCPPLQDVVWRLSGCCLDLVLILPRCGLFNHFAEGVVGLPNLFAFV